MKKWFKTHYPRALLALAVIAAPVLLMANPPEMCSSSVDGSPVPLVCSPGGSLFTRGAPCDAGCAPTGGPLDPFTCVSPPPDGGAGLDAGPAPVHEATTAKNLPNIFVDTSNCICEWAQAPGNDAGILGSSGIDAGAANRAVLTPGLKALSIVGGPISMAHVPCVAYANGVGMTMNETSGNGVAWTVPSPDGGNATQYYLCQAAGAPVRVCMCPLSAGN